MTTADPPKRQVGGWQLLEVLGTGAFGETWRAQDPSGAQAAVKLLKGPPGNELRVLSRVVHPAIISVLEAGGTARPYLAMEYATGSTLAECATLTKAQHLQVIAALLDALAVLHAAGLTHGDVKPDNLMIDVQPNGEVQLKLIDFGLAGIGQGGTLAWAAPERLRGESATPQSDVYAAGLVLWTMLHGELPFSELAPEKMLLRRRSTPAVPSAGPEWVRDLLEAMVAVDPSQRPDAASLADAFAAHGVSLPTIDADWLRYRARSLQVPGPIDGVVERWLSSGGTSLVLGAPGSGKSLVVRRAIVELSARGATWVRLQSLGGPWSAVAAALEDPRLPEAPVSLPATRDPADRAYSAARQLLRRGGKGPLHVIVDDLGTLDSGTRRVVELLVDEPGPCHVLITSEVPATFNTRTIVRTERLKPWDTEQIHELITTLLGARAVEIPGLLQYVDAVAGGQPRFAIDAVVEAVRQGALAFRDRQWVEGREALGHLGPPDPGDAPLVRGLDEPSTWLGALIAAHGYPMPRERLDGLVHWPPDRVATSLHRLIIAGLVRSEGGLLQVASAPAAMRLIERTSDPARLHMRLAEVLEPVGPSMRLGWHLAKAGDPQAVMRCGSACIALGRRDDPEDAEALSEALWRVVQTWDLATERILALLAARRPEDAATFAASLESGNAERPGLFHPAPQTLLVAWARALVACGRPADALAVIRQAQSVGRHRAESGFRTIELHEVHALALSRLERIDVAAKIAMAATSAIPAPETPPDLEDAWLRTRVIAADCLKRMGDADEAVALLAEIPGSLGAGRQVRGSLEARRGRLLWHQKRYRESAHVFAEAARASAGLSALDRARLANNSALASFKVGDPAAAVTQWERARLIFDRLGAERSRIGVQLNLCVGYLELGRWERARRAGTWSLAHAQQQGEHRYEAMAAGNLGDVHRQLEQFELAEARYHDALGIAETYGFAEEIAENLRRVGQLAQERGDEDALQRCQVAEQRARELEIHAEAGLAAALLAVAYARNGEAEPATEALARSRDELADHGDARELAEWRLCSAMVSQSLGRSDRAVAELARVVLFAEEVGSVQLRARADQVAQQIDGARLTGGPDREGMLLDMAVAVAQEQDLESLLQAIAEAALKLTEANRAFVLQRDGRRVLASAFAADADLSPPSWTIAERAIDENREVIVADLGDRPDLRASTSVMTLDLRSVMCVPLVRASDVLGALYVDSDHAAEQELVELGRYLRALAGYAAIAIANAERVAQHDRQIEDAAALAHDMRNLALVLIGLAEHVTEIETADLETIESMVDVRQVGQQLVQMTEQFLQPSLRKPEVLSLSEIIEQVSSVVRHEAERRHIELVVDAPPGHHVHVDREAVRRALFNIVHNAFKYCGDNGRVALSVSGSVEHVYFTVHDSGPGIPDEIAPYIFDFRRQGRQARQGFGIGLSVASRAVSDAGGTIRAGNHPTGGGLVTIILPRTKLAEV